MDVYSAIRVSALRAATSPRPDKAYLLRRMMRWYSKTFFTPLEVVEAMPLEDVFQAYYEERYDSMAPEDLEAERAELMLSDAERLKRIDAEEAEDAEMFEMGKLIAEEEAKRRAKPKDVIAPVQHSTPAMPTLGGKQEADLPTAKAPPPPISMSFVSEAELEADLLEHDLRGNQKK